MGLFKRLRTRDKGPASAPAPALASAPARASAAHASASAHAADPARLGLDLLVLQLKSGDAVPAGCTAVVVAESGQTRRVATFGAARISLGARDVAWCFHPGPYTLAVLPFAAAPEAGLRLEFVIDAGDPRVAQQRFDLYLASELPRDLPALPVASFAAATQSALQNALAEGMLELPPCTSIDEWHAFRAALNELLYTRFGVTVEDCYPIDLHPQTDLAATLRTRATASAPPRASASASAPPRNAEPAVPSRAAAPSPATAPPRAAAQLRAAAPSRAASSAAPQQATAPVPAAPPDDAPFAAAPAAAPNASAAQRDTAPVAAGTSAATDVSATPFNAPPVAAAVPSAAPLSAATVSAGASAAPDASATPLGAAPVAADASVPRVAGDTPLGAAPVAAGASAARVAGATPLDAAPVAADVTGAPDASATSLGAVPVAADASVAPDAGAAPLDGGPALPPAADASAAAGAAAGGHEPYVGEPMNASAPAPTFADAPAADPARASLSSASDPQAAARPAEVDKRALHRLFLELPALSAALRAITPPSAAFAQQQELLQRLALAALDVNTMPALELSAPGQKLPKRQQERRSFHSGQAAAALDNAWSLLARLKLANADDIAQLFDEADRLIANLEFALAERRAVPAGAVAPEQAERREPTLGSPHQ